MSARNLHVINHDALTIDPQQCIVMLYKKEIPLCQSLFRALYLLAEHPGWVYSKKQIYHAVYGNKSNVDIDNTIYCLIRDLRKKFKDNKSYVDCIQTVRGVGYKFVIPEK